MTENKNVPCPKCSYLNPTDAVVCSMCGNVFTPKPEPATHKVKLTVPKPKLAQSPQTGVTGHEGEKPVRQESLARPSSQPINPSSSPEESPIIYRASKGWGKKKPKKEAVYGIPRPLFYLGLGALLAPIFTIPFFVLRYMGWFFESLVHEMGHSAIAYFFGCFAIPAISLEGHACAVHGLQHTSIAIVIWILLIGGAVYFGREKKMAWTVLLGFLGLFYPLFAFTQAKEFLHLVSGHGGELIFAAVFFWRALAGGFYQESERPVYAMLAWYLWGQNLFLCWNLVYSPETRAWYRSSGSFGLENDYIRVAEMFSWSLRSVAGLMFFVSLIVPPLGLLWGWWAAKEEE